VSAQLLHTSPAAQSSSTRHPVPSPPGSSHLQGLSHSVHRRPGMQFSLLPHRPSWGTDPGGSHCSTFGCVLHTKPVAHCLDSLHAPPSGCEPGVWHSSAARLQTSPEVQIRQPSSTQESPSVSTGDPEGHSQAPFTHASPGAHSGYRPGPPHPSPLCAHPASAAARTMRNQTRTARVYSMSRSPEAHRAYCSESFRSCRQSFPEVAGPTERNRLQVRENPSQRRKWHSGGRRFDPVQLH
jgi:hypothetical protein